MKKILYCASTFGHISNFHLPYLSYFKQQGYHVTLLGGGNLIPKLEEFDTVFVPFEKHIFSIKNIENMFKVLKLLKKEKFDILNMHTALAAFWVRIALMFAGKNDIKVIYTVHGYLFDEQTPFIKRLLFISAERMTAHVTDTILTMNQTDYDLVLQYRLAPHVLQIPGMGIDYQRFAHVSHRPESQEITMVYVAEFSHRKNQEFLIKAMVKLPINVKLHFIGDGATIQYCRHLAEKERVANRITFVGAVGNVQDYLALADIGVSSSRIEGLPFNIMEYMAAGLPVIASQIKGHNDLIQHGKNGFVYPYGDVNSFCNFAQLLCNDFKLRKQMGDLNKEIAKEYDKEKVVPQVIFALEKAIQA